MDEKALLDWKDANAEVYSKFRQDLEGQLLQPYHQSILDMGNGAADPLQSVIANLTSIGFNDGFNIDRLYSKAVEKNDISAYCLCCYLHLIMVPTIWQKLLKRRQMVLARRKSWTVCGNTAVS